MIVAGFGCRAGAIAASLDDALAATGHAADAFAVPADRVTIAAPFAALRGVPLVAVAPEQLAAVETRTHSTASLAARGVGSVAEAAALAAAGPGARLIVVRRVSRDRMATCAIAEGSLP